MQITTDILTPRGKASAVALGFFDGVHLGHRAVIARMVAAAEEQGLVPTVFTFSTVGRAPDSKGSLTLLQTEREKERIMEAMGVQQIVVPPFEAFMQFSPQQYVDTLLCDVLNARVLVCGDDYRFGKAAAAGVEQLRQLAAARDVQVITVPPVLLDGEVVSSTRIRQAVSGGNMVLAQQLLGAPFSMTGEVVRGKQLGRYLGSPTINLNLPPEFALPAYGVYHSWVTTPQGSYHGATSVGVRPTVEGAQPNCETFLLDFAGDLYGQPVTVSLLQMLRGEEKYQNLDALAEQIKRDVQEIRRLTAGQ